MTLKLTLSDGHNHAEPQTTAEFHSIRRGSPEGGSQILEVLRASLVRPAADPHSDPQQPLARALPGLRGVLPTPAAAPSRRPNSSLLWSPENCDP